MVSNVHTANSIVLEPVPPVKGSERQQEGDSEEDEIGGLPGAVETVIERAEEDGSRSGEALVPPPPSNGPATVGQRVVRARTDLGLTVDDLSSCTYIRATIIRGIEQGDFRACGGDCYARGHLRILGQTLHLDVPTLLSDFDRELAPTEVASDPEPSEPLTVTGARPPFPARLLLFGTLVLVAALLVLLAVRP